MGGSDEMHTLNFVTNATHCIMTYIGIVAMEGIDI